MDYAVVMAGGSGRRLWPLSRRNRPKQVLKLFDSRTLLQQCFQRLSPIFEPANIFILTNSGYADTIREHLPEIPCDKIIAEPVVRDTAGAIGLAATILAKADPQATMAVVTADHLIEPADVFEQAMKDALVFANNNPEALVTFGIRPTFAATDFGYIKCSEGCNYPGCENTLYSVETFEEKPTEKVAKKYLDSGCHFWNSGMFVWKAGTILAGLAKFLPESTEPLQKIEADWDSSDRQRTLSEWFPKLPTTSIDYAVMEKAEKVYAIKLNCRWFDLGSFTALADIIGTDKQNNVIAAGQSELLDCKGSIIVTEDKGHLIAAVGLENMVIAHSPDATFICPVNQTARLKELLDLLERSGGEKFL